MNSIDGLASAALAILGIGGGNAESPPALDLGARMGTCDEVTLLASKPPGVVA